MILPRVAAPVSLSIHKTSLSSTGSMPHPWGEEDMEVAPLHTTIKSRRRNIVVLEDLMLTRGVQVRLGQTSAAQILCYVAFLLFHNIYLNSYHLTFFPVIELKFLGNETQFQKYRIF